MSAPETPLTDAIGFVEIYDANGQPYHADLVPASDCRAIERRLNDTVAMLEKLLFWFPTASVVRAEVEEAIANARKPLA